MYDTDMSERQIKNVAERRRIHGLRFRAKDIKIYFLRPFILFEELFLFRRLFLPRHIPKLPCSFRFPPHGFPGIGAKSVQPPFICFWKRKVKPVDPNDCHHLFAFFDRQFVAGLTYMAPMAAAGEAFVGFIASADLTVVGHGFLSSLWLLAYLAFVLHSHIAKYRHRF